MKQMLIIAAGAVALAATAPAGAQPNWDTIGSIAIKSGSDRGEANVRTYAQHNEIRLCALNAPIRLRQLKIRFASGAKQDIDTMMAVPAGGCTGPIDLTGAERNIGRIRVRYEAMALTTVHPQLRIQAR